MGIFIAVLNVSSEKVRHRNLLSRLSGSRTKGGIALSCHGVGAVSQLDGRIGANRR